MTSRAWRSSARWSRASRTLLLYRVKTLFGIERMHALPALLCSDEALMRLVGFNAHQVRYGVCQRGAAQRQGPRLPGLSARTRWRIIS